MAPLAGDPRTLPPRAEVMTRPPLVAIGAPRAPRLIGTPRPLDDGDILPLTGEFVTLVGVLGAILVGVVAGGRAIAALCTGGITGPELC